MKEFSKYILRFAFYYFNAFVGALYVVMFRSKATWFDTGWFEVSPDFVKGATITSLLPTVAGICYAVFYAIKHRKENSSIKLMTALMAINLLVFYACYIGKVFFDIYVQ